MPKGVLKVHTIGGRKEVYRHVMVKGEDRAHYVGPYTHKIKRKRIRKRAKPRPKNSAHLWDHAKILRPSKQALPIVFDFGQFRRPSRQVITKGDLSTVRKIVGEFEVEYATAKKEEIIETARKRGIPSRVTERILDTLKKQALLYEPKHGHYKLV